MPGFCHLLCNPVDILLSSCTLQLINKLWPCLFLCQSNTSPCILSYLFIFIPITCCFDFMPYLIASSFLLNSFSYLIIPPPCLAMPRWSFCPPTYLFCCLLPYLFSLHSIFSYIVSFKYLVFSICYQPSKFLFYSGLSQRPYFQPWYMHSLFFLGAELMTTSPTSNRCCDTHSSPAMTLKFYIYIVGHFFATASNQLHSLYHQIHRWPICSSVS